MPSYFFIGKTNYRKEKQKGKIKQKRKQKTLPVAWAKPAHPAQPAQRGTGVFFLDPAPPSCSVKGPQASRACRRPSRPHLPLPRLLVTPRDAGDAVHPFPPS